MTSGMLGATVISAKMTEMMKLFGCKEEGGNLCGLKEQPIRRKCTLAPPGKYS